MPFCKLSPVKIRLPVAGVFDSSFYHQVKALPMVMPGTWVNEGSTHNTAGLQEPSRFSFARHIVRKVK